MDVLRDVQSMLWERSLPLINIAARVGFQTQQHFTAQCFIDMWGARPALSALRITAYDPAMRFRLER